MPIGVDTAMEFLRAGLGDDLDAAVSDAVEFGGEGILVDAHFEDGGLGRNLAALESVDVDLAAVGSCGGAGECLQLILEFVGIVGERVERRCP